MYYLIYTETDEQHTVLTFALIESVIDEIKRLGLAKGDYTVIEGVDITGRIKTLYKGT